MRFPRRQHFSTQENGQDLERCIDENGQGLERGIFPPVVYHQTVKIMEASSLKQAVVQYLVHVKGALYRKTPYILALFPCGVGLFDAHSGRASQPEWRFAEDGVTVAPVSGVSVCLFVDLFGYVSVCLGVQVFILAHSNYTFLAVYCSALQCVVLCCCVLPCVAVCCGVFQESCV